MKRIFIGKQNHFIGKTVFEILANLRNFGIGRMITRNILSKYPEPSYHIIKRVEPRMDEELKFGTVYCETVFRGKRLPGIRKFSDGYKADFKLIPKEEEELFLNGYKVTNLGEVKTILPKHYSVPPLMRLFLNRYKAEKGETIDPNRQFEIPFVYIDSTEDPEKVEIFWLKHKIAFEDEVPDLEIGGNYRFYHRYTEGLKTD